MIDFLARLAPNLQVNVFELTDAAGVGATLPEVQACVLTQETRKGGEIVNNMRAANGLAPVKLVFADMILSKHSGNETNQNHDETEVKSENKTKN